MDGQLKAKRLSLFSIFLVFFLDNFGWALAFPIMAPLLLSPQYHFFSSDLSVHVKNILLGIALASFSIGNFFGAPVLGDLADSVGRRKIFFFTITATAAGFFLSAFAVILKSYIFLVISRFLSGIVGGNLSICLASIVDLSDTESEKRKYFGYITTISGIAWISSILINGLISNPKLFKYFSPVHPFWLCGFFLLISLIFIYKYYEDPPIIQKGVNIDLKKGVLDVADAFSNRSFIKVFSIALFWYLGSFMFLQWLSPYYLGVYKATQLQLTYLLLFMGIAWTLGSCVLNAYFSRFIKTIPLFMIATFMMIVSLSIPPLFHVAVILYIMTSIESLFAAVAWPNLNNLVSLAGTDKEQGKLMGLNSAMIALAEIVAPILGGVLVVFSYKLVFYVSALFCSVALIIMSFVKAHFQPRSYKGEKS